MVSRKVKRAQTLHRITKKKHTIDEELYTLYTELRDTSLAGQDEDDLIDFISEFASQENAEVILPIEGELVAINLNGSELAPHNTTDIYTLFSPETKEERFTFQDHIAYVTGTLNVSADKEKRVVRQLDRIGILDKDREVLTHEYARAAIHRFNIAELVAREAVELGLYQRAYTKEESRDEAKRVEIELRVAEQYKELRKTVTTQKKVTTKTKETVVDTWAALQQVYRSLSETIRTQELRPLSERLYWNTTIDIVKKEISFYERVFRSSYSETIRDYIERMDRQEETKERKSRDRTPAPKPTPEPPPEEKKDPTTEITTIINNQITTHLENFTKTYTENTVIPTIERYFKEYDERYNKRFEEIEKKLNEDTYRKSEVDAKYKELEDKISHLEETIKKYETRTPPVKDEPEHDEKKHEEHHDKSHDGHHGGHEGHHGDGRHGGDEEHPEKWYNRAKTWAKNNKAKVAAGAWLGVSALDCAINYNVDSGYFADGLSNLGSHIWNPLRWFGLCGNEKYVVDHVQNYTEVLHTGSIDLNVHHDGTVNYVHDTNTTPPVVTPPASQPPVSTHPASSGGMTVEWYGGSNRTGTITGNPPTVVNCTPLDALFWR